MDRATPFRPARRHVRSRFCHRLADGRSGSGLYEATSDDLSNLRQAWLSRKPTSRRRALIAKALRPTRELER